MDYNYVVAGTYQISPTVDEKNNIEKHDVATGVFSAVASVLTQKRSNQASAEVLLNGVHHVLSVCGMYNANVMTDSTEDFNCDSEVITTKLDCPVLGVNFASPCPATSSKFFLLGGNYSGNQRYNIKYEANANAYTTLCDLSIFGSNGCTFKVQGTTKSCILFGMYGSGGGNVSNYTVGYDRAINIVISISVNSLPSQSCWGRASMEGNNPGGSELCGWIFGGAYGSSTFNCNEYFNVSNHYYVSKASMPGSAGALYCGGSYDKSCVYALGGLHYGPTSILNAQYKYAIAGDSWSTSTNTLITARYRGNSGTNFLTEEDEEDAYMDDYVEERSSLSPALGYTWMGGYREGSEDGPEGTYAYSYDDGGAAVVYHCGLNNYMPVTGGDPNHMNSKSGVYCKELHTGYLCLYLGDGGMALVKTSDGIVYEKVCDIDASTACHSMCIVGTELFLAYTKIFDDSSEGVAFSVFDLVEEIFTSIGVKVDSIATGIISLSVDGKNTNNILVMSNTTDYAYSMDKGQTWSEQRRCFGDHYSPVDHYYPPLGSTRVYVGDIKVLPSWNAITKRIDAIIWNGNANSSPNNLEYAYFDFSLGRFVFVAVVILNTGGLGYNNYGLYGADAIFDSDYGYAYVLLKAGYYCHLIYGVRIKLVDDVVVSASLNFIDEVHSYSTSSGDAISSISQCHITGNIIFASYGYDYLTNGWCVKHYAHVRLKGEPYDGLFIVHWYYSGATVSASPYSYAYGKYFPILFNTNSEYWEKAIGEVTTQFFNFVDKSIRLPVSGKTILLKDSSTGSTVVTFLEHALYKGLYYGVVPVKLSIHKVDVYVDGVKSSRVSPIVLVPSEYWPEYKSQH